MPPSTRPSARPRAPPAPQPPPSPRRPGRPVGLREQLTGWNPQLWAGWRPNGVGEQKPNHYAAMARTIWDNRRHPVYAAKVLTRGSCDGCALGVTGLHDWTIDGVHLCTTRLDLLKLNTADPIPEGALDDVAA